MTLEEFLFHLSKTKETYKWGLVFERPNHRRRRGGIRTKTPDGDTHCPISAVTNNPNDFISPKYAGEVKLQLDPMLCIAIVECSDGRNGGKKGELRRQLLSAVGLKDD